MSVIPSAGLTLNLKALVPEPVWPQPVAAVLTVHEEVDSVFASDPGEHILVAVMLESKGLIT